jgi:hypothetical protein
VQCEQYRHFGGTCYFHLQDNLIHQTIYQNLISHKVEILTKSVPGLEKSEFEICFPAETLFTELEMQGPQPAELLLGFTRQYLELHHARIVNILF